MTAPFVALLGDRAILSVSGAEARVFLNGLVTNDIEKCKSGAPLYAALLTPQGRILYDFIVATSPQGIYLDAAAGEINGLVGRLLMYRLRSKVDIALRSDLGVAALWGEDSAVAAAPGIAAPDPRLARLGWRIIAPRDELRAFAESYPHGDYASHRLALGVPDSADIGSDRTFALDAGFEELHGVSFRKGCYVGQEVTARMKHRATARRRFYIVEADGALPAPGTTIAAAGRDIGTMAMGKDGMGLALVRLDRVAEAVMANAAFTAAGAPVRLKKPEWLAP
jgi:tRNA-modifying protein YgfZ